MSAALVPTFRVHCFWGSCGIVLEGFSPDDAHDRMEEHYAASHANDITKVLARHPRTLMHVPAVIHRRNTLTTATEDAGALLAADQRPHDIPVLAQASVWDDVFAEVGA